MIITFTANVSQIKGEMSQSISARLDPTEGTSAINMAPGATHALALNMASEFLTEMTLFGELGHCLDWRIVEGICYIDFDIRPLPGEGRECLTRRKRPEFEEAMCENMETAVYSALREAGIEGAE